MNEQVDRILKSTRLPARLTAEEVAIRLGFQLHDIPVLVAARLLKPLGKQVSPNSPKHFATSEIEEKAEDIQWLNRATDAIRENWRKRNAIRRCEK